MSNKRIVYHSPKNETLQRFAKEVSAKLAQQQNDQRYADQEVIDGLADFLKVVSELLVKHLNSHAG